MAAIQTGLRLRLLGIFGALASYFMFAAGAHAKDTSRVSWPQATKECRPWAYWCWMGSAVDRDNLTELLAEYRRVGIGGVTVIPMYGVKGCEGRFIDYLSAEWLEIFEYAASEAERLDMGIDTTLCTGWPYGGPWVSVEDADSVIILKSYNLDADTQVDKKLQFKQGKLQAVMGYSPDGNVLDLTDKVDSNGVLDWVPSEGNWDVYAVSQRPSPQRVKRAGPGGAGYPVNPFSYESLRNHLSQFDKALAGRGQPLARAYFHDSFEYAGNWTPDFFEQFKSRRGYDLRRHLPALLEKGTEEVVARVKSDYRETLSDMLLERFTVPWVEWCHKKGSIARNQAHGSPGNVLDLYAAADIPETEVFGPVRLNIPGLRTDPDSLKKHYLKPDPLVLKFASSAAHLTGKRLTSSETCTWLGEHFKIALSQVKAEADLLFVSGVNHISLHNIAYSPADAPWPGWLFYASANFGPSNTIWRDFPEFNAYVARCCSILQSSRPANDILVYFPIYDWWHGRGGMLRRWEVWNQNSWFNGSTFQRVVKRLWNRGYTFDYVSDRLLARVRSSPAHLESCGAKYQAVIVPECRFMPIGTMEKLIDLAKAGATIIFQENMPRDVPGLGALAIRQERLREILAAVAVSNSRHPGIRKATIGSGQFLIGRDIEQMLGLTGVRRESIVDTNGINFVRRAYQEGYYYFIANMGELNFDGWITLGTKAISAAILDPLSSTQGLAAIDKQQNGLTRVYLQLQAGESRILQTFSSSVSQEPGWKYWRRGDRSYELKGTWEITFVEGGPSLPASLRTKKLASWTKLGGTEAEAFSGTALYTIKFDKPAVNADDWVLDLGRVCESVRVRINGRSAGTLFSVPFQIRLGQFLREGVNLLELEVTNLTANRIADMDRRKIPWKRYHDINFVNMQYNEFDASDWAPMDSGLIGPVHLIPCVAFRPGEQ
ncbi:MAG: hypothetical protein JSU94_05995 [Phycisphaerales bacterium]|nr:MAG: hypothetical protein JSU94_05995 [Phycisphaerales bacterium]